MRVSSPVSLAIFSSSVAICFFVCAAALAGEGARSGASVFSTLGLRPAVEPEARLSTSDL